MALTVYMIIMLWRQTGDDVKHIQNKVFSRIKFRSSHDLRNDLIWPNQSRPEMQPEVQYQI